MYKIRPYVYSKTLLTLYYSLIYPHLIYGIEVWGSSNTSCINRLMTLQNGAVRVIIFKDKRQTDFSLPASIPLFNKLKILKIYDIFKIYISRFVFKCLNKLCMEQFHSWFITTSCTHTYSTRSSMQKNLYLPHVRTTFYGLKSIKFLGPKIWNALPAQVKMSESYVSFSSKLKEYILNTGLQL